MAAPHPADLRIPSFVRELGRHGAATAVLCDGQLLTYAELVLRAEGWERRLGATRRLVLLVGASTADALAAYLGALAGGHVVLLVPSGAEHDGRLRGWVDAYDPDVVVDTAALRPLQERRSGTRHELHPELALLLSTSGSTGSPKLVRLSHENLDANAESIAVALGIGADDRAITTLPMTYCYGLSVLHSHLARGASVVLTDASVTEDAFWELCREHAVTSLAGVPHTYALLERRGFLDMHLPALRTLTQAGGRMPAEQVRRFASAGRERGWRLFVMYGQTEATARMAVLPAELAVDRPSSVGVPVPGGELRLDPVTGHPGQSELVYRGPNVMLGYATGPADLALGRTVHELRTGDLGRQAADGLFEITGRRSRFAKVLGLRIDLDRVEQALEGAGSTAWCGELDDALVVLVEGDGRASSVRRVAASVSGLPLPHVRGCAVAALPRTASGKVDGEAAARAAGALLAGDSRPAERGSVRDLYAEVLGRRDVSDDCTFVGLGGDSLSYVEMSLRLEDAIGELPQDWHVLPIHRLEAPTQTRGRPQRIDTTVALRALAILLIVGSHAQLFAILGGAHSLVAVAGFNFARFRLTAAPRRERAAASRAAVCRVLVPSVAVIGLASLATPGVGWAQTLMLNDLLGPSALGPAWRYWFVEALLQVLVVLWLLLQVPALDRAERRLPFAFPAVVLGAGLLTRFDVVPLGAGPVSTQSGPAVLWLFALGWCAARARTTAQRAAVSAVALLVLPGFLGRPQQELVVAAAVLLLVWTSSLPLGRLAAPVRPVVGVLASSSLYIYLTHWQVLPLLPAGPAVATLVALLVGAATWRLAVAVERRVRGLLLPEGGLAPRPHRARAPGRMRACAYASGDHITGLVRSAGVVLQACDLRCGDRS